MRRSAPVIQPLRSRALARRRQLVKTSGCGGLQPSPLDLEPHRWPPWPPAARRRRRQSGRSTRANVKTMVRPWRNGPEMRVGEKGGRGNPACWAGVKAVSVEPSRCHRVVAQEGGKEHRDRRQIGHLGRSRVRHALGCQAMGKGDGQAGGQPHDHDREEYPDRERHPGVLEGGAHARGHAPLVRPEPSS